MPCFCFVVAHELSSRARHVVRLVAKLSVLQDGAEREDVALVYLTDFLKTAALACKLGPPDHLARLSKHVVARVVFCKASCVFRVTLLAIAVVQVGFR